MDELLGNLRVPWLLVTGEFESLENRTLKYSEDHGTTVKGKICTAVMYKILPSPYAILFNIRFCLELTWSHLPTSANNLRLRFAVPSSQAEGVPLRTHITTFESESNGRTYPTLYTLHRRPLPPCEPSQSRLIMNRHLYGLKHGWPCHILNHGLR